MTGELAVRDGLLGLVERARAALVEVETVEEAIRVAGLAESVRYAARQAKAGMEAENAAAEVRLRAERRAGELLAEMPKQTGGDAMRARSHDATEVPPKLADIGVTKSQSSRYQHVAAVPEEIFQGYIDSKKQRSEEITTAELLRQAREARLHAPVEPPPLPSGVWDLLLADPPWRYNRGSVGSTRAIENHYPTLALEELCALEPPAADDALLFLWATNPKLAEALFLMSAWGFEYLTNAAWVKDRIGMGYYFRARHELLLVGRRGNAHPPGPGQRFDSVIEAPRAEHSVKPAVVHAMLEEMYPNARRLELFARMPREGWDVWGNEVTGLAASEAAS